MYNRLKEERFGIYEINSLFCEYYLIDKSNSLQEIYENLTNLIKSNTKKLDYFVYCKIDKLIVLDVNFIKEYKNNKIEDLKTLK